MYKIYMSDVFHIVNITTFGIKLIYIHLTYDSLFYIL